MAKGGKGESENGSEKSGLRKDDKQKGRGGRREQKEANGGSAQRASTRPHSTEQRFVRNVMERMWM